MAPNLPLLFQDRIEQQLTQTVQNIYFSGGVCSGGHGLSIGSVGGRSDNTVKNVTFYNSEIKNSQNGRPLLAQKNKSSPA